MTVAQAIEQILEVGCLKNDNIINENMIGVGLARIGQEDQKIVSGTLSELLTVDFGKPLHSLVIPGRMHFLEADFLKTFAFNSDSFEKYCQIEN